MIPNFPKIFTLGQKWVTNIFDDVVEITEKIDGSQFCFGKVNGSVLMRSKGAEVFFGCTDKLFAGAVEHIDFIQDKLPDNIIFYSETVARPKHNTIEYERIPKNRLVLFGASTPEGIFIKDIDEYARILDIDRAPVLFSGMVTDVGMIHELMNTVSYLGKSNIEGVVVKNYNKDVLLGGVAIPVMCAKFVSEQFKETHKSTWNKENTLAGKLEKLKEMFRTEARWNKAIQHLRESGELEDSPRDIGKLINEIKRDVQEEGEEEIRDVLFGLIGKSIVDSSILGFPEWYKNKLLEKSFNKEE